MKKLWMIALCCGLLLGLLARVTSNLGEPLLWILNLGVPWLAVAFIIGSRTANRRFAAALGSSVILISVATYYVIFYLIENGVSLNYAVKMTLVWGAGGIVAGALFAYAGSAWKFGSTKASLRAVALLSGALISEALFFLFITWLSVQLIGGSDYTVYRSDPSASDYLAGGSLLIFAAELVVGLLLPFLLVERKETVPALAATFIAVFICMFSAYGLRYAMWYSGWQGI